MQGHNAHSKEGVQQNISQFDAKIFKIVTLQEHHETGMLKQTSDSIISKGHTILMSKAS